MYLPCVRVGLVVGMMGSFKVYTSIRHFYQYIYILFFFFLEKKTAIYIRTI